MNIPKELVTQWLDSASFKQRTDQRAMSEYIAQRAAEWALSQPVSMEPEGAVIEGYESERIIHWRDGFMPSVGTKLYTADQLAQARQHGAEEELKEWEAAMVLHNNGVLRQRIAELEQKNAQLLEALKAAYKMAVDQDNSKPVDWALYCEFLYQSIKAAEVKP